MYCTPWARLMTSITPNTRVSPAAMRNSSRPSCSPFRAWTTSRVIPSPRPSPTGRGRRKPSPFGRGLGEGRSLRHLALGGVGIDVGGQDLLARLGLVFAVRPLHHLGEPVI